VLRSEPLDIDLRFEVGFFFFCKWLVYCCIFWTGVIQDNENENTLMLFLVAEFEVAMADCQI
jgi:hypothetical protein